MLYKAAPTARLRTALALPEAPPTEMGGAEGRPRKRVMTSQVVHLETAEGSTRRSQRRKGRAQNWGRMAVRAIWLRSWLRWVRRSMLRTGGVQVRISFCWTAKWLAYCGGAGRG